MGNDFVLWPVRTLRQLVCECSAFFGHMALAGLSTRISLSERVIGQSTATLRQCVLSGKSRSSMGQHQLMALGYANCKAPCRRQRPPLSCDTCVGMWGAELALDIKISILSDLIVDLHELNILSCPNKRCPVLSSDGNEDRRSCCLYRRLSKGSGSFYKLRAG